MTDRNLGEQPIARLMKKLNLNSHDLVTASSDQMTHKMISRACKGRRLTANTQSKVKDAMNRAAGREFTVNDLFTYYAN